MSEHFDRNETRTSKSREAAMFREFKAVISITRSQANAVRAQTRGVDINKIQRIEDLSRIPVMRRETLCRMMEENPPHGGYLAARPGAMRHLLRHSAGGHKRDWWNSARGMYAAGFTRHDTVLNCASYHMSNGGHLVESGAAELRCAVIPAGDNNIEWHLDALRRWSPTAFAGKPGALRRLLDRAASVNCDTSSLRKAMVFASPLSSRFRHEAEARGLSVRQCYTTPEAGVVAYETSGPDGRLNAGMIVNEGVLVEIVRPGTDAPAAPGDIGEIVLTRLDADFPLLRFSTGDLSRILPGPSPCGRTNLRIAGWLGRVNEIVNFCGCRIFPSQILEIQNLLSCHARLRLVLRKSGEDEQSVMRVDAPTASADFASELAVAMRAVLGFEAPMELAAPGGLADSGKFIVDERAHT